MQHYAKAHQVMGAQMATRLVEVGGFDPEQLGWVPYYNDAEALLTDLVHAAGQRGYAVRVQGAFNRLCELEPQRAHRLATSLKKGRVEDVINGLLEYRQEG